jgi:hypothetical protein
MFQAFFLLPLTMTKMKMMVSSRCNTSRSLNPSQIPSHSPCKIFYATSIPL